MSPRGWPDKTKPHSRTLSGQTLSSPRTRLATSLPLFPDTTSPGLVDSLGHTQSWTQAGTKARENPDETTTTYMIFCICLLTSEDTQNIFWHISRFIKHRISTTGGNYFCIYESTDVEQVQTPSPTDQFVTILSDRFRKGEREEGLTDVVGNM